MLGLHELSCRLAVSYGLAGGDSGGGGSSSSDGSSGGSCSGGSSSSSRVCSASTTRSKSMHLGNGAWHDVSCDR